MRYYRKLLNISYKDHITNEELAEGSKQPLESMMNSWPCSRNKTKVVHATSQGPVVEDDSTGHSEMKKKKR